MTALSPLAFAAIVWGSIGLVVLVFCWELYTVVSGDRETRRRSV